MVSGGDVGIPLLDGEQRQAALVPQNVDAFGAGLDIPDDEVRLYLAVRELAHARLFRHAKWLRLHLLTQITDFARGIRIDTDRLEELAADFDPPNPEELRDAMTSGALIPPKTDEQLAALARLETMLALIEGWVDVVTAAATDAPAEERRDRRDRAPPPRGRRPGRVGVRHPRRTRAAPAPPARGGRDVAGGDGCGRRRASATRCGRTPTSCPTSADIDDPSALVARLTATGSRSPTTSTRPSRTC